MVQGRECRGGTREADGHVWDPDGWYPTGDRGCDGRLYTGGVWTCLFQHPNGQRCSAQVPGFGTGSLFGVSIAGHDPEDPERFRPAARPKAKVLAHEASHEMPLTKEEAQDACFSGTWWQGNRKRVYELEKADNDRSGSVTIDELKDVISIWHRMLKKKPRKLTSSCVVM